MGRGPIRNREVFEKFKRWWKAPEDSRTPPTMSGICRELSISIPQGYKWQDRLREEAAEDEKFEALGNQEVTEYIEMCRKKAYGSRATAQDLRLYAEVKGFAKKDDTENQFQGLSADDYHRIWVEAKRRVQEFHRERNGDRGVQPGHPVFPDEVRLDAEQEYSAGDKVGSVAVSC